MVTNRPLGRNARLGWLLRINRVMSRDPRHVRLRGFAGVLHDLGTRPGLAPSTVFRWENGTTRFDHTVVRAYEDLLAVENNGLVAITDTVARFYGDGTRAAPMLTRRPQDSDTCAVLLDELIDRARHGGDLTGADWNDLTGLLCQHPHAIVSPRSTWSALAERLMTEMAVADGVSWMHRSEAFQRLIAHPVGGPAAIAATASAAADRSAQSMIGTVSVFDATASPTAAALVVRHLRNPVTERTFSGALLACFRKVRYRHFTPLQLAMVMDVLVELLAGSVPAETSSLALAVLRLLPDRMKSQLDHGIWDRLPAMLTAADGQGRLVARVRDNVSASLAGRIPTPRDAHLHTLISEAVFCDVFDQRLYAQLMLYSTPYRPAVADALGRELARSWHDPVLAVPLLEALRVLGMADQRLLIERLLLDPVAPASIRDEAACALAHADGQTRTGYWRRVIDAQLARYGRSRLPTELSVLDRITYAVGMADDLTALAEIAGRPEMPQRVRVSARWWLSLPGHIRRSARS